MMDLLRVLAHESKDFLFTLQTTMVQRTSLMSSSLMSFVNPEPAHEVEVPGLNLDSGSDVDFYFGPEGGEVRAVYSSSYTAQRAASSGIMAFAVHDAYPGKKNVPRHAPRISGSDAILIAPLHIHNSCEATKTLEVREDSAFGRAEEAQLANTCMW